MLGQFPLARQARCAALQSDPWVHNVQPDQLPYKGRTVWQWLHLSLCGVLISHQELPSLIFPLSVTSFQGHGLPCSLYYSFGSCGCHTWQSSKVSIPSLMSIHLPSAASIAAVHFCITRAHCVAMQCTRFFAVDFSTRRVMTNVFAIGLALCSHADVGNPLSQSSLQRVNATAYSIWLPLSDGG